MRLVRLHPPLIITALAMLVLTVVSVAGLIFDDRYLNGVPIWLKPLKFTISIAIYTVTIAWFISLLDRGKRAANAMGTVVAAGLFIEMVVIAFQAARGRMSHFNYETTLDTVLWITMAVSIVLVWLATLWLAVLVLIQRVADRPQSTAIRMGLVIALFGLAIGFLMTMATSEQRASMQAGDPPTIIGAHNIGVPDGGPGLPLVNWSTEGGDLRAAHFIGMHALQALPLLALLLAYLSGRITRLHDEMLRTRLIIVAGATWAAFTALIMWQALRGQPLTGPDALTLGVAGAIVVAALAGLAWAVLVPRSPGQRQAELVS